MRQPDERVRIRGELHRSLFRRTKRRAAPCFLIPREDGFCKARRRMGAASGLGDLAFLSRLRPVSAAEAQSPATTSCRCIPTSSRSCELLEDTPREKLLEVVAGRIHEGLNYRDLVAALQLAGVRNIQPRPHVGFKFHAVLVVNSAHIASVASPDEHRWLPIFWALDHFKDSQADDVREGDWTMQRVDETHVPTGDKAGEALIAAMDNWDVDAADAAAAGLARTAGTNEIFEIDVPLRRPRLSRYRPQGDLRLQQLAHAAIDRPSTHRAGAALAGVCAAWRTKATTPASAATRPTCPGARISSEPRSCGPIGPAARWIAAPRWKCLATLRQADEHSRAKRWSRSSIAACTRKRFGTRLLLGAGELLVRQPGIVALHAVTTSNALRYAWDTSASDDTRRMLLLQNAAFLPMFRQAMVGRGGKLKEVDLDAIAKPVSLQGGDRPATKKSSPTSAATRWTPPARCWRIWRRHPDPTELVDAARC